MKDVCSLRVKNVIVLAVLFLVVMTLFMAVLLGVLLSSFEYAERSDISETTTRVTRAIMDDFKNQMDILLTYSNWDSSYYLMKTYSVDQMNKRLNVSYGNIDHVEELTGANFIGYYFLNGTVAGKVGYDFESRMAVPMPTEMYQLPSFLMENIQILSTMNIGYWTLKDGTLFLVMAAPVQCSGCGFTDTPGIMMWARYIRSVYVSQVSNRAQVCITMYNLQSGKELDSEFTAVWNQIKSKPYIYPNSSSIISEWKNTDPTLIRMGNVAESAKNQRICFGNDSSSTGERIITYQTYQDIYGQPSFVLRTDFSRSVRELGLQSFGWSYGFTCLVVILSSLIIFVLNEVIVVTPLVNLGYHLRKIMKNTENLADSTIPVKGITEISTLTQRINTMLRVVAASSEQIAKRGNLLEQLLEKASLEEQKTRILLNSISDMVLAVDRKTANVTMANTAFFNKTRYSQKDLGSISRYLKEFSQESELLSKINQLVQSSRDSWETHLTKPTSEKIPVKISAKLIQFPNSEKSECESLRDTYLLVCKDLSEEKKLKEKKQQNQQLLESIKLIMEFDKMFNNTQLRQEFKKQCEKERSVENFLFLETVEQYRRIPNAQDRVEKQQQVLKQFIDPSGDNHLNISGQVLQQSKVEIENGLGRYDALDKLETFVRDMVINDTWFRYCQQRK
ncbi:hypothetical protein NAEGRDRAFT_74859 [Naegleria gruberi]|uniref:RGS domain-containing protein n=1 Tax=Naegleria gruberi TaxID=5762 RepID=D2W0H3_NAEGR|nr:uncharacterized protein NAEGRDRAFT_74859 [Naegleria gruberi]EFC37478.1 hypothetical protein NAEGRDRAFT_74859 [Naegleria gruberi]|eukprot:XP_002670222.1 hypothetical protein NAEGRDRAFT_74859 [Naegleria gruberi strain NEG-M]